MVREAISGPGTELALIQPASKPDQGTAQPQISEATMGGSVAERACEAIGNADRPHGPPFVKVSDGDAASSAGCGHQTELNGAEPAEAALSRGADGQGSRWQAGLADRLRAPTLEAQKRSRTGEQHGRPTRPHTWVSLSPIRSWWDPRHCRSPSTASRELEQAGAGGLVVKSLFEEQIQMEEEEFRTRLGRPRAGLCRSGQHVPQDGTRRTPSSTCSGSSRRARR
jgi:hypothetical protein